METPSVYNHKNVNAFNRDKLNIFLFKEEHGNELNEIFEEVYTKIDNFCKEIIDSYLQEEEFQAGFLFIAEHAYCQAFNLPNAFLDKYGSGSHVVLTWDKEEDECFFTCGVKDDEPEILTLGFYRTKKENKPLLNRILDKEIPPESIKYIKMKYDF